MSTATPIRAEGGRARGSVRLARALVLSLALLGIVLATWLSRERAFQVDEVEHVHVAYNLDDGRMLYRDFWEGHNPLLYLLLRPLVDPSDPVGSFRRVRWLPLAALVATAALAAYAARRLGGTAAGGMAGALVLTHSTMVERGLEVRPDGLLSLATMAALALEVSGLPPRRRFPLQGLVLGLAFVATQKAIFACAGFAAWWTWHALRERQWRRIAVPAIAGGIPFAVQLIVLAASGALPRYLDDNVFSGVRRVARATGWGGEFGPAVYLVQEGRHNLVFSVLAAGALILGLRRILVRDGAIERRGLALLGWLLVATLWLNPFPFPYLHVTVLPALAVLSAVELVAWVERVRGPGRAELAVALVVVATAATALPRLASRGSLPQGPQLSVLAEVQRLTTADDAGFDLVGLYFRRDAYPVYVMTGAMISRYLAGDFPRVVPALRADPPPVIVASYRIAALGREEQEFLAEHYVHHDGPIFVHGRDVERLLPGEQLPFEVLKPLRFRWIGPDGLLVDGKPFRDGVLVAGTRVLSVERPIGRGRLVLARATRDETSVRPPFELYPSFD